MKHLVGEYSRLLLRATVTVALGLSFCNVSEGANTKRIVVIIPTTGNQFWLDVRRGAENAKRSLIGKANVEIAAGTLDADANTQIELLNSYLDRNAVDALVIGPASATAPVPVLAAYKQKNIPIVVIDSRFDPATLQKYKVEIDAVITSDNAQGGQLAAQELERAIGTDPQKNVLLLEGSTVHETAKLRTEGFTSEVKTKKWKWNVVVEIADWQRDKAQESTASHLAKERIDGIFANSDKMALGAVSAIIASGMPRAKWPKVVGFDATLDGLQAVRQGDMVATIQQRASQMGEEGVATAWKLLEHAPGVIKDRQLPVEAVRR